MKIKDMIFSDGQILHYFIEDKTLELYFKDYCENTFLFRFLGITKLEEKGSVGFDLSDSKLSRSAENNICELFDDDGVVVLKIVYDACEIMEK